MKEKDIAREELFALIWEKPTVEVARDMGISDVAVAKLCARLKVPKPPRGYWAKIEAGQRPRRPPLRAFRDEIEDRRKATARPRPGAIGLSPIQRKFVDRALAELVAKAVDIGTTRIVSNQIRDMPPDIAAQVLLLVQNRYLVWIKTGDIDVALTHGAKKSLAGLVEKLLPVARPQVLVMPRADRRYGVERKEPCVLIRLTAHLQERIAHLAMVVRDQKLAHVVMPLVTLEHAWSAHHVYSSENYATARSLLCVSAIDLWVDCTIDAPRFRGDDSEAFTTEKIALREIMPIDLMPGKDVEIPPAISRVRIKEHWPRLRALIEAERVFGMLERSAYALERDVPDEHLAVADRIWFGAGNPLLNARKAWDRMFVEMERWEEELEAERADLCCAILDIALGDIVVQPDKKGQITRIQVIGTSMAISDDRASLFVEGTRFRKDGTLGKRLETIRIDFK
jgi:hypothetical protein